MPLSIFLPPSLLPSSFASPHLASPILALHRERGEISIMEEIYNRGECWHYPRKSGTRPRNSCSDALFPSLLSPSSPSTPRLSSPLSDYPPHFSSFASFPFPLALSLYLVLIPCTLSLTLCMTRNISVTLVSHHCLSIFPFPSFLPWYFTLDFLSLNSIPSFPPSFSLPAAAHIPTPFLFPEPLI